MADTKTYRLAHPLDAKIRRGSRIVDSPFTKKDRKPGDTIPLTANQAANLARAGYLNLDEDGKPLEVTGDGDSGVPPRTGAGSGRDEWAAYAGDNNVEVTDEMNRDAIIAALDAAGIATTRS